MTKTSSNNSKIRYFFILIILSFFVGHAQNSVKFDHLNTENGLSQSDVNTIFQDDEGFMWFGTHDGLNRYDGYDFKVFKPNSKNTNSISSNLIFDIVDDKTGNLWIGTTGNGLNYFDKDLEVFKTFKHDQENKKSIVSDHIKSLFRDSNNRLWINTIKGIDILDLNKPFDSLSFKHLDFNKNSIIETNNRDIIAFIYEDSAKHIWLGSSFGLFQLSRDKIGDIYFKSINSLINLPMASVRSIAEDRFNTLIIATSNGLFRYMPEREVNKTQRIQEGSFTTVLVDKNHIWAGTDEGLFEFSNTSKTNPIKLLSLYKYDPKNPNTSLSKNLVKSLYMDNIGNVWIGTNGGGVNKFDPQRKQFNHIKNGFDSMSLSHDKVRSIFQDSKKNLWIGTEGGGLNLQTKNTRVKNSNEFKVFNNINKVFAIEEIELKDSKKLFFGGEGTPGLYQLDLTSKKEITNKDIKPIKGISNRVFSILQDADKNIWIGSYNEGLQRLRVKSDLTIIQKETFTHDPNNPFSLPNNIIRDIFQDSRGDIWFATGHGLARFPASELNSKQPKFDIFKNNPEDLSSISHNYILTIYESKVGDIWVGTLGGGLNKVIKGDSNAISFKVYSEEDGLPNDVIKGILEGDDGQLWLSTNKGLSKFNPIDATFQNYDVNDGLQSNEFSELAAFKMSNGELLFGGVNGLTSFKPSAIINNKVNAETVFTNFSLFNKPVKIGEQINGRVILPESINSMDEIELKYDENSISFEFAALHFAASKKNKYAYKLEGFNKEWLYTSADNRIANYTNLAPGMYTLRVKASNNDNIWDETPIAIKIHITPPFWRTKVAYFLYILLFISLLLAFRRYTIMRSTTKYEIELAHIEKVKNEELHRLKLEFYTNISHEFRTPLTLIKGPIDYLIQKGKEISPKELIDQHNMISKNTTYLLRLVNQLLDFRKMDHGKLKLNLSKSDIVEFLKEVGEPFQFLSHKKHIKFEIKSSKSTISTWFDPDAIEKIANNLLSNAFKFTPEEGTITLSIFDENDFTPPDNIDVNIDPSEYIVIEVKDSGPGIPAHRIKHIFERYYSDLNISSKTKNKGSGIGLSYTNNLVKLHQGIIKVKSDAEHGTAFYVWLPKKRNTYSNTNDINFHEVFEAKDFINQKDAESHAISVIDDIADQNITRSRSKLPVLLLVEDNPDIRSFIKKGLGESYYIYEASNGKKGLEQAIKFMPNIVITDLVMPEMDGIEFCNKLKTAQETSHIPVVILTAKLSQEKEIEGLKIGADAYLRKPFNLELLELKLSNILKHREQLRKRFIREVALQPNEVTVTSSDELFLQKAIKSVESNMTNSEYSVEMFVQDMLMSRSNVYLKIKELTGLSTSEFIRTIRLKRALQLFETTDLSVKEVMYRTGFNTASYFSKCFKKQFGIIPSKYIKNESSEDIITNRT
ncbi:hybrid sensor histidine kinase/response regulator transcription factor [Algibacter mikhailovii]|uniref:hybrid sensor histidine kinase/response regulator transcription factor n=1 Tax=Algibacter mikhailovii TaxID=425498 RepID=UPI0024945722|nr:two-component regulator propeller domain-containing protein [Algibacter mikhailovii]